MDECGFFCCIKNFQKRIYREIGHGTALANIHSLIFWGRGGCFRSNLHPLTLGWSLCGACRRLYDFFPPLTYGYTGLGKTRLSGFISRRVVLLALPCLVLLALPPGGLAWLHCLPCVVACLPCLLALLLAALLLCLAWLLACLALLAWWLCTRISRALSYHASGLALITLTPRRLLAFSLLCFVLSACAFSTCSALWQARQIVSRLAGSSLRLGACLILCKWCTVVAGVNRPARLHTWHR